MTPVMNPKPTPADIQISATTMLPRKNLRFDVVLGYLVVAGVAEHLHSLEVGVVSGLGTGTLREEVGWSTQ